MNAVPPSEANCRTFAMFIHAADKIISYTNVKRATDAARKNVDPIIAFHRHKNWIVRLRGR